MPQPPPSSQAPPSTPNPSRFRLPRRPDRAVSVGVDVVAAATPAQDGDGASERAGPDGQPPLTAGKSIVSSQARPTQRFVPSWSRQSAPLSQFPFSQSTPASALVNAGQFSSSSKFSRSHQRRLSLDEGINQGDAIEESSSPLMSAVEAELIEESPPRPPLLMGPATSQVPPSSVSRTVWQPKRRRSRLPEDIDEAGSSTEEEDDDVHDLLKNDGREAEISPKNGLPDLLPPPSSNGPASRLVSTQPFKRRRLFVSPGLIMSSSPSDFDDGEGTGKGGEDGFGDRRRKAAGLRTNESDDGIVDDNLDFDMYNNDDDNDGDGSRHAANDRAMDDDEIREILGYDELGESGRLSDGHYQSDGGRVQSGGDEEDEDEDAMVLDILDRWPKRRDKEGMDPEKTASTLPTFQRARLFATARRRRPGGDEDDGDHEAETDDPGNGSTIDTPRAQRYYQQLPADFFSPQKRQKGRRYKNKQSGGIEAAVTNATEQYVPGGLAAELRDWLVQIKSGGHLGGGTAAGHFVVHEVESVPGINLGYGYRHENKEDLAARIAAAESPDGPGQTALLARLLLAGEGRRHVNRQPAEALSLSKSPEPMLAQGGIVSIAPPVWDIVLDGETWTVASNWGME